MAKAAQPSSEPARGVLELHDRGYGFLRDPERAYRATKQDIFVPPGLVKRHRLKEGVELEGPTKKDKRGRGLQLAEVTTVCGMAPDAYADVTPFDQQIAIDPDEALWLETVASRKTTRVLDLVAPIGKGQRGLIVSPPRAGKTTLLEHMAQAVTTNYPEVRAMMVLVDERPEEVTHFRRATEATVIASSNDQEVQQHLRLARLAFAQAKALTEAGQDVVIFMDSLTRVGRAFNKAQPSSGRTLSGGLDIRALEEPKRLFGAARNFEDGGSLTVVATCLIDTGSRMDELIFQEFKGTGNMECVLSRDLAEKRLYPAIDVAASGTRKEERFVTEDEIKKRYAIRRRLAGERPAEALEALLGALDSYPTNQALLDALTPART